MLKKVLVSTIMLGAGRHRLRRAEHVGATARIRHIALAGVAVGQSEFASAKKSGRCGQGPIYGCRRSVSG